MSDKEEKKNAIVYFDGDCPMCKAFVPFIDEPNKKDSAKFENLRTSELPQDISLEQATKKIHVITENGEILKGAKAVFKAMEINNKYPLVVAFGRLPIISSIAEVVYAIIAKNRFILFDPKRKNSRYILILFLIFILTFILWML